MSQTWRLFDANNLCHRNWHALRESVGMIYGFLRDIGSCKKRWNADHMVFAFDSEHSYRKSLYPEYKANRPPKPQELIDQMELLRTDYIPSLGYKNALTANGYEADDIIASVINTIPEDDYAVIISSDRDLYQLLKEYPFVNVYHPVTEQLVDKYAFKKRYGIKPRYWVATKAIMGDSGDNIKGIQGVGEITALKFLLGSLKSNTKAYEKICSQEGADLRCLNHQLISLPFDGTPSFSIQKDDSTLKKWKQLITRLGYPSLEWESI